MSHFVVAVFTNGTKTVDELLAPYDENIVVEPYVQYTREQAIADVRKEIEKYKNTVYAKYLVDPEKYEAEWNGGKAHIEYLKNEFPLKLQWTDEQCYQDMAEYYEEDMVKPNGDLMSTYNPNSKWDWYVIGGRWNNILVDKNGNKVNGGLAKSLVFDNDIIPFAVVTPDGQWYERGSMGWWGCFSNENKDWESKYYELFENASKSNCDITIVDCHI